MQFHMDIPDGDVPWECERLFCGVVGAHNPYVYNIISEVLLENAVESIIEFGTYFGALSAYLGLWGARLGVPVATFDIAQELADPMGGVLAKLNVSRYKMDVLTDDAESYVLDIIGGKPTYMICDGGDKTREFIRYLPLLPNRSLISVHDWQVEVEEEDIGDIEVPLLRFKPDQWMFHDAKFATWMKIGEDAKERIRVAIGGAQGTD